MKIEYTEAKIEFVEFDFDDIITTSVPEDGDVNPGGPDPSDEDYSGYH